MKPDNDRYPIRKYGNLAMIALVALVLLAPAASHLLADELIRIRVFEKVEIDHQNILLGSMAEFEGGDRQKIQELRGVVVGRAPLPGHSRRLDGGAIKLRLKQNGIDLTSLSLEIPSSIIVSRSFIEIGEQKISELVSEFILQNSLSNTSMITIKSIQVSESTRLPSGHITYEVTAPRNRPLAGQVPFAVNFAVNGKPYKRVWATAMLEVLTEVVVTSKPLGRHKPITEDDIVVMKMDLAKLPADVVTDPEAVLGKRTRRAIGSKTVLRANLVEFPPLVRRGDVVVIVAETEGLKITALGQVKKKGALGDRIPVVNFESKKVLYARVVDSNTVEVDF